MRACAFALATLLAASGAWAQTAPDALEAEHRRGMDLFREHRDAEAREVFRALVTRTQEPRALARLAATEAALGEWVEAETHLRAALAAQGDAWIRANRTGADGGLEGDLRRYIAHVGRLEVRCEAPGATVWVGGAQAATLPMTEPMRVVAGTVTFEVRAPGHITELRRETVSGGAESLARVTVTLTPSPVVAPQTVSPPERPSPSVEVTAPTRMRSPSTPTPMRPAATRGPGLALGIVATSVGVAGLVMGVTGLLVRNGHATTFNDDARCGVTDDVVVGGAGCQSAYDARQPAQTLSIVGFVAGGALVAAGITALVMTAASAPTRPRAVSVTGAPGDLGVGLRVVF